MLTSPKTHTPRGTAASPRLVTESATIYYLSSFNFSLPYGKVCSAAYSNAAVMSPAPARTPGSGVRPKRSVMNFKMDVVS